MSEDEVIRQVVHVSREDLPTLRQVASSNGVEVHEVQQREFEPATMIMLVLVGGALAIASVTHALEVRKGGQIIDLRPGASMPIYRSKDLLYGLILVFAVDGKVSVQAHEAKGTFDLISEKLIAALPGLAGAKSADVQHTLSDEIASGAVVVNVTEENPANE